MAHSPAVNHVCFAIALLCTASYCCRAQDPIQIVANAALCFDNRMVINSCLTSMGINTNGSSSSNGTTMSNSTTIQPKPHGKSNATAKSNSTANSNGTMTLCSAPCYGQMMLTATCIDGIFRSFQFYSPGLVQGVQAIVNMTCRGMMMNNTANNNNSTVSLVAHEQGPRTNAASASARAVVPDYATLVVSAFSILFIHRRSQISW
ncbi:uncharacterized protein LOC141848257 [Curcuma longa]|uniref:uncharacterized protein LOC141848257 n=1 Tax=Curcuma longa TaxID=136217 RepID=UPI003D9F5CBD